MRLWKEIAAGLLATAAATTNLRSQTHANPVADALRDQLARASKNFVATAEAMPADKYSFKPTDGHMTFAAHLTHIGDFSEMMCSLIGGTKPNDHAKVTATASKDAIVQHVRNSFAFCTSALASLTDAKLAETVPFFGSQITRAAAELILSGDWSDHYAVTATYLRLNGILPPTAKM